MVQKITVEIEVNASQNKVWDYWTKPEHITKWNFASDDWECPKAENDLKVGGKFTYVMAARDGSAKFDFNGTYNKVDEPNRIEYKLEDERQVIIKFLSNDNGTKIIESFDAEGTNSDEQQRQGWQAILNNFKKHIENE